MYETLVNEMCITWSNEIVYNLEQGAILRSIAGLVGKLGLTGKVCKIK